MRALLYDADLQFSSDPPQPVPPPGEALIHVLLAGICNTVLEITLGYLGFCGILGHESVGRVEEAGDRSWVGQRVVGEVSLIEAIVPLDESLAALERALARGALGFWSSPEPSGLSM